MKQPAGKFKRYWDLEESATPQGNPSAELYLYGYICTEKWWEEDVTPNELVNSLQALGDISELNVHVFSNGGDVFAGNAIYSLLKQRKEPVNIFIEGIAASIASVIAMAGDTIYIAKNAMMMIHNPMVCIFGMFNKIDMTKMIAELDRVRDVTMMAYTDKTGIPQDEINAMLDANDGDGTWMTADEAVKLGFADAITPEAKAPADMAAMIEPDIYECRGHIIDLSVYKTAPKLPFATAQRKKGMTKMARAKAVKRGKIKAELASIECPHCHTMMNFDTASGLVTLKPEEDATVAVPMEAKAKSLGRAANNFQNELFKVTCPECGGEFEFETEPDAGGQVTPTEGGDGALTTQARRSGKVKAARKAARPRMQEDGGEMEPTPETVTVPITCTECNAEFEIDIDPAIEEVVVPCPECGAELTIDTAEAGTEPDADAVPPSEILTAFRKGIVAERRRMQILDIRAKAFPQFADAINCFKQNGTSVKCANNWLLTASGANPQPQAKSGRHSQAAARRDAKVLNNLGNPVRGNGGRAEKIADAYDSLAQMRGVKKNA